jgi:hypothetical protein
LGSNLRGQRDVRSREVNKGEVNICYALPLISICLVADFVRTHSLKSRGLDISKEGVSVKTFRRFDREDYVDATQRSILFFCKSLPNSICRLLLIWQRIHQGDGRRIFWNSRYTSQLPFQPLLTSRHPPPKLLVIQRNFLHRRERHRQEEEGSIWAAEGHRQVIPKALLMRGFGRIGLVAIPRKCYNLCTYSSCCM